jgi:hypothetical protein
MTSGKVKKVVILLVSPKEDQLTFFGHKNFQQGGERYSGPDGAHQSV